MNPSPLRVAVTGVAGQIGYSLLFRIASGAMFGPNQPVILHLIEIEPALPALQGVERKDLLGINGKIFIGQGQAIQKNAASDVRILVVGNPCNTNCLIAMNNAPQIPRDRWFAMTRLDENRAKSQLAKKAGVDVTGVRNVAVWGNHSATQYPDFENARIDGR